MLYHLHVKNMALIKEAEVDFGPGLNILTGETGAGKSIIIGSVTIALGSGAFRDLVSDDTADALVELVFETDSPAALAMLEEAGIETEDGQIVLARKYHNGKSISRVNGESVPLKFIKELAGELIDIHGQHEHQSLLYPRFHLQLLDRYCAQELGSAPDECADAYRTCTALRKELDNALTDEKERTKRADLIAYEIGEIDKAQLVPGEDEILEAEYKRMENGQKILEGLQETLQLTDSGDGASDSVSRALRSLSSVMAYDPALEDLFAQLSQAEDLLSGFCREARDYVDSFTFDPQLFEQTAQRLDLINHLKSKYGPSIGQILAYRDEQQKQLDRLTDYEGYLADLTKQWEEARRDLSGICGRMSRIRKAGAEKLEKQIVKALEDLNFAKVRFTIDFTEQEPSANGSDHVCFMISLNPGMPLRPLQDTASGGELSRIMLALKSVMADEDGAGTLIFDEIDSGISGRTAQKVSEKMILIAAKHQVICITHLAQIAAMADRHFVIEKEVGPGSAQTLIRPLDEEESVQELARILGGARITDAVTENAREMKQLAAALKQKER